MKANHTDLDLRPWEPVDESPALPGPALATLRASLGLRPVDLARALGRKNVSKFCNRISDFEQGRRRPSTTVCADLDRSMSLKEGHVASLWDAIDHMERAHQRVRVHILNREMGLLRSHHESLMTHRYKILAQPDWANARIEAATLHLMWAGGGCFTVGELLEGWLNGQLLHPTINGQEARIVSAHGSALSGLRGVVVLETNRENLGPRPTGLHLRRALRSPRPKISPLSFGDVLAAIGVTIPDLVIRNSSGEAIARYCHYERVVSTIDGRPLIAASDHQRPGRTPSFSQVRIGSRPIPEQTGPLRGAWTDDQWNLEDGYTYRDGRIIRGSSTALWLDAVPPPGLVSPLAQILG